VKMWNSTFSAETSSRCHYRLARGGSIVEAGTAHAAVKCGYRRIALDPLDLA